MDKKKLRENLGNFSTGVIIACARKKNFFATKFFSENFLENNNIIKKFEDFWQNFFEKNSIGNKISKKFFSENFKLKDGDIQNFLDDKIFNKIKTIFSDEFFGMTINSFTSISLDPPLISFCIDNKSSNLKLFKQNRYFLLNILSVEQKDLSSAFATPKNSHKWHVEPYFFSKYGNPIFYNSISFIECKKHKTIKMGDHEIIIGEIVDFAEVKPSKPLLYFKGKYCEIL